MGESSAKQQDDARARELYRALKCWRVVHYAEADIQAITAAFAEVRRQHAEHLASELNGLASRRVHDWHPPFVAGIRHAVAVIRDLARRSLAPEPPDQPGAETKEPNG